MTTTVQPRPDTGLLDIPDPITPIPTCRLRTATSQPIALRKITLDEIDDVEWLLGWATAEEISRSVGRASVPALIRFLHRAGRWDLAIRIMPIPLDPVAAHQTELKLVDARWRAVWVRVDIIRWVTAWNATRPGPFSSGGSNITDPPMCNMAV